MYSYIKGQINAIDTQTLILEVGGIGWEINPTQTLLSTTKLGDIVTIFTHLDIKENAHTIYGFLTLIERDLFRVLLTVSGIGAKSALSLLSLGTEKLVGAVISGNSHTLSKVKGISAKTAEKIIIELKSKVQGKFPTVTGQAIATVSVSSEVQDAILGLLGLGMNKVTAQSLISQIETTDKTAEEIIMSALQKRGN